jgi:acetyltransferase
MTPASTHLDLTLRDGTPVIVRPLVPADRNALAEAYRQLSPDARFHRFWTRTGEMIGDAMLNRILDLDPTQHVSWTVLDPTRKFPGLGAASWWRNANHPTEAEISITVLDRHQNRGIGTLLLAVLWLNAFNAGIETIVAYTLHENRRAAAWMKSCGATGHWDGYKLVFRWDLANLDALPTTPTAAHLAHLLATLSPILLDGCPEK